MAAKPTNSTHTHARTHAPHDNLVINLWEGIGNEISAALLIQQSKRLSIVAKKPLWVLWDVPAVVTGWRGGGGERDGTRSKVGEKGFVKKT